VERLEDARGPLDGLRVVDLSPDSVGAQVSQTLADFGADVLWIEAPEGNRLRTQPSFPFMGRGKRSLVADVRTPQGVETIRSLAASADVFIETFRPGVADRLGLGYEALAATNPALVYTSITGFGRQGPWANLKGYEGIVASVVGLYGTFGFNAGADHPPFLTVPWCTLASSQAALHGILAALFEREASGAGQWVETNLAQAVTIHEGASSSWYTYLITHRYPDAYVSAPPVSGSTPMHHFMFRLLVAQTKDGRWLQFAQNRPHLFDTFLKVLGLDWMLSDPKWKGIPILESEELRLELLNRLLAGVRDRTMAEWEQVFDEDHDVYAEMYRSGPEVLEHPQLIFDNDVIEIDDPERGPVRQPGPLFRMSDAPARVGRAAPTLDNATEASWLSAEQSSAHGSSVQSGRQPLEGVTIIELAVQYAAPYATTLLADLGARVVKVEALDGDSIRRQNPQFPDLGAGKVMQGKESIAVNIHTPEGLEILHKLVARADGVLNGFRAGAAERGGFDAATLQAINPALIYLSAAGYGVDGPCGDRPAFAPSFGAASGIAAAQLGGVGPEDPSIPFEEVASRSFVLRGASAGRYASADGTAALAAATAMLMALVRRARGSNDGQYVKATMVLSTAHSMANHVVTYPGAPEALGPGTDLRGPSALYRIYDAADGWIFLAAPQTREWEDLADGLAPYLDLRADPRFATAIDRAANDAALTQALTPVFVQRGKAEWQKDLTEQDVACVAVTTEPPEELLMADEFGRASGYLADITHPIFGEHPRLAPVVRFSRSATTAKPACLLGDATDGTLRELGYSDEAIADLKERNIVV
jgi:crotonobetainyl-CoA:carnitine CoA-transferase CaiB-like acyl-CoA transferase